MNIYDRIEKDILRHVMENGRVIEVDGRSMFKMYTVKELDELSRKLGFYYPDFSKVVKEMRQFGRIYYYYDHDLDKYVIILPISVYQRLSRMHMSEMQ